METQKTNSSDSDLECSLRPERFIIPNLPRDEFLSLIRTADSRYFDPDEGSTILRLFNFIADYAPAEESFNQTQLEEVRTYAIDNFQRENALSGSNHERLAEEFSRLARAAQKRLEELSFKRESYTSCTRFE